jgi:hypothetical protein
MSVLMKVDGACDKTAVFRGLNLAISKLHRTAQHSKACHTVLVRSSVRSWKLACDKYFVTDAYRMRVYHKQICCCIRYSYVAWRVITFALGVAYRNHARWTVLTYNWSNELCVLHICFCNFTYDFWHSLQSRGHAVVQLVEALRYKPEGRGFDYRWYHWNFSLT